MLSPEYLLRVSEGGEAIAETLHNEIIQKMVERIAHRLDRGDNYILTATDKWQIEVLQDAGYLREDIEKILAKYTGLMQEEIAEAMEDAGVKALDYDDAVYRAAGLSPDPLTKSPHLIRLMQRTYEATMGEWVNFTRTTAEAGQMDFIRACDKAYSMVASGASGYSQTFVDAINSIVDSGVKVTYPSGHTDTIETATLRCIRTGVSQATAQITDARMAEMDWDIILVSSHLGARVNDREDFTNHYWWQGKFYSRSGRDKRFPPFSVCGMGNVQGIHGANCRHQHGPGDGEFNPYEQYDSEENRKEYELQQRQRAMERRIRESKRKCIGLKQGIDSASTPEGKELAEKAYQRQAALLQKRNQEYNDFCKENNLKKLNERITIAKWDRSQAAKARAAAKKAEKSVANPTESGTINKKAIGRKITQRGEVVNPMPREKYHRIRSSLESKGIHVVAATDGDDLAYLLRIGAEGTYSNGWLSHIGEVPSKGTLFEELIHMAQAKKYGELDSSDYVELFAREIEANRKLMKCKDAYGLDTLDIADIERNLKSWEKAFKERTGVSYDESNYRDSV